MTKVNSFRQGALTLLAIVGLVSQSFAQSRCGGSTTPSTGCTGFKTYTQGGWGSPCNSGPGRALSSHFATAFPFGLEVGCTKKLKLTSAYAVQCFLPSSGTPAALSVSLTNPSNYKNTFAGQLVAATLNVGIDNAVPSFSSSSIKLKDLIISSGTFAGWTVEALLAEANKKIGGCSSSSFSFSQLTDALDRINRNYDNGTTNNGFLSCPPTCSNVTSGGTIAANEANCGSFDPAEITSSVAASGGSGTLVYAWYSSSDGSDWSLISGAASASYNPSSISSTTYYKRTAKRSTCPAEGASSNVVVKTVNSSPSASIAGTTNVLCFQESTGSVNLQVSGGTPAYSFAWDNGSTSEDLSGVAAGSYNVVVTDANGCKANASATVGGPSAALTANAVTTSDVLCKGGSTGMVTLAVSGGTADYSFLWSNGATTQNLSGVEKGDYSVTVTDANGCTATASANVNEPAALSVTGSLTKASACNCNGTATLNVSGGTPEYSYLWSNGSTEASVSSLCLGQSVSVTVTDANGCTFSDYALGTVDMVRGCTAAEIIENHQAKQNNGAPVLADRSNPTAMYGEPDASNAVGGFFSLGFGGWVVLKLDGAITDQPGNDLKVFETTYNNQTCGQYPEYVRVAVSPDNVTWTDLGVVCHDNELDIAPAGACINYVKLTDETNPASFRGQIADGYDVDGIKCITPVTFGRGAVSGDESSENGSAHWITRSVNLFPNPADSKLNLELTGGKQDEAIRVTIVNHVGQVVKTFDATAGAGQFRMDIPVEDLARGIYNISIKGGDLHYNQKIVKK